MEAIGAEIAAHMAAGKTIYGFPRKPLVTVDSQWFVHYCGLVLGWDYPVLEAVGVYWQWIKTAFDLFNSDPPHFPWEEYQDISLLLCILRTDGLCLKEISHELQLQHPELTRAAVRNNSHALKYVPQQTPDMCWTAVNKAGMAIQHIRDYEGVIAQYPDLPMVAVKSCGYAIQFIRERTPELCMAAVTKDGAAIQHIREDEFPQHYEELCVAAVTQNRSVIYHIRNPSPTVLAIAEQPQQ